MTILTLPLNQQSLSCFKQFRKQTVDEICFQGFAISQRKLTSTIILSARNKLQVPTNLVIINKDLGVTMVPSLCEICKKVGKMENVQCNYRRGKVKRRSECQSVLNLVLYLILLKTVYHASIDQTSISHLHHHVSIRMSRFLFG